MAFFMTSFATALLLAAVISGAPTERPEHRTVNAVSHYPSSVKLAGVADRNYVEPFPPPYPNEKGGPEVGSKPGYNSGSDSSHDGGFFHGDVFSVYGGGYAEYVPGPNEDGEDEGYYEHGQRYA